jgi:hypothetical protein
VNDITVDLDKVEEEILANDVSDEALEVAAGMPIQAGASLWSTVHVSGCTCES